MSTQYSVCLKIAAFWLLLCTNLTRPVDAENLREYPVAPDFSLPDLSGKTHRLSDYRGRVVLLDFWATWCPPCRLSTPALVSLNAKLKGKKAAILAISLDETPDPIPAFVEKMKVVHPVLFAGDDPVGAEYAVRGIPAFYIIDKKGRVRKKYPGYFPGMEKAWEKSIFELLSEE